METIYDDRDRLRFSKNSANTHFSVVKYDLLDRPLGVGKITDLAAFTEANANNPAYPAIATLEQGTVYDERSEQEF